MGDCMKSISNRLFIPLLARLPFTLKPFNTVSQCERAFMWINIQVCHCKALTTYGQTLPF